MTVFHGRSLGGERPPKASGQALPPQVAEVGRAAPGDRDIACALSLPRFAARNVGPTYQLPDPRRFAAAP
jgi:hypothetical protein